MRMRKHDFKGDIDNFQSYYDIRDDWDLIESSFAKQYGIRLRQQKDMPWSEFSSLISGLMSDTPLGAIITIRAEKDIKVIKKFNSDQRRIYIEWRNKSVEKRAKDPQKMKRDADELSKMLESAFGKKGGKAK